jgi:hypothetical protein
MWIFSLALISLAATCLASHKSPSPTSQSAAYNIFLTKPDTPPLSKKQLASLLQRLDIIAPEFHTTHYMCTPDQADWSMDELDRWYNQKLAVQALTDKGHPTPDSYVRQLIEESSNNWIASLKELEKKKVKTADDYKKRHFKINSAGNKPVPIIPNTE